MNRIVLSAALTLIGAGSALAADMAVKARSAPAPVAVANWTGCYIGGGGGYGLWNQENTEYQDVLVVGGPRVRTTPISTAGGRGWFGTVQGGCDYQMSMGSWQVVIGAFGDYDFADLKGQLNAPTSNLYGQEKMTDKWSVGGRIGVLITPQLLSYFSGGYTEAKYAGVTFDFQGAILVQPAAFNWQSQWYKGWFIGSGYEYALSFMPGLYWKTEYRFSEYDVGTNRLYLGTTNLPTNLTHDSKKYDHMVRSELVWRFNMGGGAVVAKY